MNRLLHVAMVATLAATVGACQASKLPAPADEAAKSGALILQVDAIDLLVMESYPVQRVIVAEGTVPSGGWTAPRLMPRRQGALTVDGIFEADFMATPPEGPAIAVLSPIDVRHKLDPYPENLRGIRIFAKIQQQDNYFRIASDTRVCLPAMTITRFAPSPSGYLHLGHAYSALFARRIARQSGGHFLLRIEDIDRGRCRVEFETAIKEDMTWLGLAWNGPVRRQSDHIDDYERALDRLGEQQLIYPCFCTRKDIKLEIASIGAAPHGPDGPLYPGTCRAIDRTEREDRIAAGEAYALRLDMAAATRHAADLVWRDRELGMIEATPARFGDVVLARKDTPTSYHLAVTVDDALQQVTIVSRGVDLLPSTDVHRLLQALLDLPTPDYHHHPLLAGENGKRFAKRDQSLTIRALRESGLDAHEVIAMADRLSRTAVARS